MKSPIVTFDNLDYTEDYAPTAANFPSCLAWFPMTEAAGSNAITDVIGGRVLTGDTQTFSSNASPNTLSLPSAATLTTGTWPDMNVAGKTTVVAFFGRFSASVIVALGAATAAGARLQLVSSAIASNINDGTTNVALGTLAGSVVEGGFLAASVSQGGTVTPAYMSSTPAVVLGAASPSIAGLNGTNFNIADKLVCSSAANARVAAIGIFQFNRATVHPDTQAFLAWMAARVWNGDKNIYPMLKGVS